MARILAPCSILALLLFGLSSPALADIVESPPEAQSEPKSKAELRAEAKQAKQDAKEDDDDDESHSGCSVQEDSRNVLGLAALVLIVSGASLARRRA